jgi:uncharacterized protein
MHTYGDKARYTVAAALFALSTALAPADSAQAAPPTCRGQNMLEEMQAAEPAVHAKVIAAAKVTSNAEALLWRIDKQGLAPSHLFGTVHVSDPRVTTLSPAITSALTGAKAVALEIADMSPAAMQAGFGNDPSLMISPERGLAALISAEEFAIAKAALVPSGLPEAALRIMKPWVVTMALTLPACEQMRTASGIKVLDQMLGDIARASAIPVIGLETIAFQLKIMAGIPEDQQVGMVRAALKFADRREDMLETMLQLYVTRQSAMIWPFNLALAEKAGVKPDAFKGFETDLLHGRNLTMRDSAKPHLEKGGLFIGVGAMHLVGEKGLVSLLRESGYTVTAVE